MFHARTIVMNASAAVAVASLLIVGTAATCPAHASPSDVEGRVFASPHQVITEFSGLKDVRVGSRNVPQDKSEAPVDEAKSSIINSQSAGPSPLPRVLSPPSPPVPVPPPVPGSLQIINIR
jgi:hypothetical protein